MAANAIAWLCPLVSPFVSILTFEVLNQVTFNLDICIMCGSLMTIALLGLKVKGQGEESSWSV